MQQDGGNRSIGGEGEIIYNRPYSENGEISVGYTIGYDPEKEFLFTDTDVRPI